MTLAPGFLVTLTEGFAELLAARPAVELTWQASGQYSAGETGIFVGAFPAAPDRLVTLTPYPLSDDPASPESTVGMQVRSRGATPDPREVIALDDAIANELLGLYPVTLPNGARVVTLHRTSSTTLGQEDGGSRRWAWSSNYTLSVFRPTPQRR